MTDQDTGSQSSSALLGGTPDRIFTGRIDFDASHLLHLILTYIDVVCEQYIKKARSYLLFHSSMVFQDSTHRI